MTGLPRLAVWKFTSCDGCQLSLLDCEDELLAVAGQVEIAYFMEASSRQAPGPYDLSIVEGSVTTAEQELQIREIREQSAVLVAIGACATAGGIQALRNLVDVRDYIATVYADPEHISTLQTSTPISEHVAVDFELRGCPISKEQLLEVLSAFINRRRAQVPAHAVCVECKLDGTPCLAVSRGLPCLGPATHAGCGALCPRYNRPCFGCYGPKENANPDALARHWHEAMGVEPLRIVESLRQFNAGAEAFHRAALQFDPAAAGGGSAHE
jgi:coenzyme F420-reducing hydrogenase gamma subunit